MKNRVDTRRVIVDPRDGRMDYFLPVEVAKKLYSQGKISIDVTNSEGKNEFTYSDEKGKYKHLRVSRD